MPQLVLESLDNLVSAREAAQHCGVTVDTIHKWRKKGHLEPADVDSSNHALYRLIDVMRAEQKTRRRMLGANRVA